jgi:hypothetical protein
MNVQGKIICALFIDLSNVTDYFSFVNEEAIGEVITNYELRIRNYEIPARWAGFRNDAPSG